MQKLEKTAIFFIIGVALFQSWTAYVLPVRGDEAFLVLKGIKNSWTSLPYSGLGESVISIFSYFGENIFTLRVPSILFLSLSLGMIYKMAFNLGGSKTAWFSMISFAVLPSVSFAYTSITPNGLFIFFATSSIYSLYKGISDNSGKHYTAAMVSALAAFVTHASGIIFVFIPLLYLLFKREFLEDKKYMTNALIGLIIMSLVIVLNVVGYIDILHTYPVRDNDNYLKRLALLSLPFIPSILVVFILILKSGIFGKETVFFNILFFITNISALILISFIEYDIRNLAAFMIPSIILIGYIFAKSENFGKYVISGFIILMFVYSAVTSLYLKCKMVPSYISSTRIYETLKYPIDKVLNVGKAIYSTDPLFSSLIAINVNHRPEACTINSCSATSGVFVSNKRENDLEKYFDYVLESGTYRITSMESGIAQFYFYDVMGLKDNISVGKVNKIGLKDLLNNNDNFSKDTKALDNGTTNKKAVDNKTTDNISTK